MITVALVGIIVRRWLTLMMACGQNILRYILRLSHTEKYGCPIYDELCDIFTRSKATGEHGRAIGGYRSRNSNVSCPTNSNGRNKRLAEPSSSGPNKRSNSSGADGSRAATGAMTDDGLGSNSSGAARSDEPHSASCCLNILNGMEGVDRRLYNAALDLFKDRTWREVFVTLKNEKRLGWLKAMLPRA